MDVKTEKLKFNAKMHDNKISTTVTKISDLITRGRENKRTEI